MSFSGLANDTFPFCEGDTVFASLVQSVGDSGASSCFYTEPVCFPSPDNDDERSLENLGRGCTTRGQYRMPGSGVLITLAALVFASSFSWHEHIGVDNEHDTLGCR